MMKANLEQVESDCVDLRKMRYSAVIACRALARAKAIKERIDEMAAQGHV